MFLARFESDQGPVIGIGLRPQDLHRLVLEGRPVSFALSDTGHQGPDAHERVLLAYARPEQMEQFRHGYFPGITDARVVLFIDHGTLHELHAQRPLNIQTPGSPIARFVVFLGSGRADAERAFRAVGLPVRLTGPLPKVPPQNPPLAPARWAQAWDAQAAAS